MAPVEFGEWVATRRGALLRTAYLLTADTHDAEDLVQAALERVSLRWQRIAADGAPEPYVRKVLYHQHVSGWRRHRGRMLTVEQVPDVGVVDEAGKADLRIVLDLAVRRLTAKQRAVLVLRFYEDLSESQTAAALGVGLGTVKSQTRHALGRLRVLAPELRGILDGADDGALESVTTTPGGVVVTSLRQLMADVATAAVAPLPDAPDAAMAAVRVARRRRRRRAVGLTVVVSVTLVLGYAALPALAGSVARPVPAATNPALPDRLPASVGTPPPWLPQLSDHPVGRIGLVVADGGGPFVVSSDGTAAARLPLDTDTGSLSVSEDGMVLAWSAWPGVSCDGSPALLGWYDARSGQVRSVDLTPGSVQGGLVSQVLVSPDGSDILVQFAATSTDSGGCSGQVTFELVDSSSGSTRKLVLPGGAPFYTPLAWDPDSRTITLAASDADFVGGPNHAARVDLTGRVVARWTISRVPVGPALVLPSATGAMYARWVESGDSNGSFVFDAHNVLRVWQVGLQAGRANQASSYLPGFASFGNAGYLGRRQDADILTGWPVNDTGLASAPAVIFEAGPNRPAHVLISAPAGMSFLAVPSTVIADAKIAGTAPEGPPWWSPNAIGWALRTYWPWPLAIALLAVLAAWAWPRVRSRPAP